MKSKILINCLILSGLMSYAHAQTSISKWQNNPITIDGIADDWGERIRFFNSESKINYEFRNDAKNLYVILRSNDQNMQKQMMLAGIKLKFKVKFETPLAASLTYPGLTDKKMSLPKGKPGNVAEEKGHRPQNREFDNTQNNERLTNDNPDELQMPENPTIVDSLKAEGFLYAPKYIVSGIVKPEQIACAKTHFIRAKDMVYEFSIPLCEFAGNNFNLEQLKDTQFQLQISIDAPIMSTFGKGMGGGMRVGMGGPGSGMGGHGGGMGGPGGGEMGGMGGGPGGDEMGGGMGAPDREMGMDSSMSAKKISVKFTLATKPE